MIEDTANERQLICHARLDELDSALSKLQQGLTQLHSRLEFVMRNDAQREAGKDSKSHDSFPLAETLRVQTERITCMIKLVDNILSRLEV